MMCRNSGTQKNLGVVFCPVAWTENLNFLQDKICPLDWFQQTVSDKFCHLYLMLLDLKCNPLNYPNADVQAAWISMIGPVCALFKQFYVEEITDFPNPMFSIMRNLPNVASYSKETQSAFQSVITTLCDYFECQIEELKGSEKGINDTVGSRLISTSELLTAWCSSYEDLYVDKKVLSKCVQALEYVEGFLVSDQSQRISNFAKEKCTILQEHLLQGTLGEAKRSQFTERDLVAHWKDKFPGQEAEMRYLVVDGRNILCVINPPKDRIKDKVNPTVCFISRNPHSDTSVHWMRYESDSLTESPPPQKEAPSRPQGVPMKKDNPEEVTIPSLREAMKEKNGKIRDPVDLEYLRKSLQSGCTLMDEHLTEEKLSDFIAEQKLKDDTIQEAQPPEDLKIPECASDPDSARMFLSHAGFLSPKMFESNDGGKPATVLLKNSPKLQSKLETFDKISFKNRQTVVILYAKDGQKSLPSILNNSNVLSRDQRFKDFALSLGSELVDVCRSKGWTGLKDGAKKIFSPVKFPYYSDSLHETVFMIPNLLPSEYLLKRSPPNSGDGSKIMSQEELIKNIRWDHLKDDSTSCKVFVVWRDSKDSCQSCNDICIRSLAYRFKLNMNSKISVIFVNPLDNGFARITIMSGIAKSEHRQGDQMLVVRDNVASAVVRDECLLRSSTASLLEFSSQDVPVSPRMKLVDEIIAEHQCNDFENGYFNCFFGKHSQ